jgi:hypothetical protein
MRWTLVELGWLLSAMWITSLVTFYVFIFNDATSSTS